MFYYVYVLKSKKDKGTYTGFTGNLAQRIKDHSSGYVTSTKDKRPLELVYFEGYLERKKAIIRERYLKTGWGRNYIDKIIND